jgi:hypothetical protein
MKLAILARPCGPARTPSRRESLDADLPFGFPETPLTTIRLVVTDVRRLDTCSCRNNSVLHPAYLESPLSAF